MNRKPQTAAAIGELTGLEPRTQTERKHIWEQRWLRAKQFLEKSREAHQMGRAERSHRMTMSQLDVQARSTLPVL